MNQSHTPEAYARWQRRAELQRDQDIDPLAKRAELVAFWLQQAKTNRHYLPACGSWMESFCMPLFRHLLMPRLRAHLESQARAAEQQRQAELRAYALRCRQAKAEREAAKRREEEPQEDLFA